MAFKRSAVRSRVAPPKPQSRPSGRLLVFYPTAPNSFHLFKNIPAGGILSPRGNPLWHDLKPIHIHHAMIGNLQMRNDRQAQKRQLQERLFQRYAQGPGGGA
jgi:hypothetical protein